MSLVTGITFVVATLAVAFLVSQVAHARSKYHQGPGTDFRQMRSIGDVIFEAKGHNKMVQILYVHGMRADASDASKYMVESLLASPLLKGATATAGDRQPITLSASPRSATVAGHAVWAFDPATADEAWRRSLPFVIHTRIRGSDPEIIVTEVNWWPLLMALRCRFLVVPDAELAGPHRAQLEICSRDRDGKNGAEDPYFPWIDKAEADRLIASRPGSGGSAKANGFIKRNVFNWGIADAVISLGPMQELLRQSIDKAAELALAEAPAGSRRVLVAESLGSFVAMDSARDAPQLAQFIGETRDFYFLANQFALLELGRIEGLIPPTPQPAAKGVATPATPSAATQRPSPLETLRQLVTGTGANTAVLGAKPAQVVAVSDPSDMLTYNVPQIPNITVSNLYWRFSGGLFKIFANPLKAHRGAVESRRLWRVLLQQNLTGGNGAQGRN